MTIESKKYYNDSELLRPVKLGETIEVSEKHGEILIANGYGVVASKPNKNEKKVLNSEKK